MLYEGKNALLKKINFSLSQKLSVLLKEERRAECRFFASFKGIFQH